MTRCLLIAVAAAQLCGCHYARRWTADREAPEHARIVTADEARRTRDRPRNVEREVEPAIDRVSQQFDDLERPTVENRERSADARLVQVKAETGARAEPGTKPEPASRSNERRSQSARSRWDTLLESFGRPRRIPLPRTDVDDAAEPDLDRPNFDGI